MNYRKLFTMMAVALAMCVEASAQDMLGGVEQTNTASFDKIWKQKKHLTVGFGPQTLTNLDGNDLMKTRESTAAFSLQMGKTFFLHQKPLANMVKIGIDWDWIDINYAKYKKNENLTGNINWGGYNDDDDDFDDYFDYFDDDDDYGDYFSGLGDGLKDLGCYHLNMGMAVGPSVQVAPFYSIGKGLEHLKAYTYFHVIPSGSLLFFSENDETKLGYSYVTNFSWGIGISWRFISIGFETRWGSAKHNMSAFDEDSLDFEDESSIDNISINDMFKTDKVKYKTTKSMFTISLRW